MDSSGDREGSRMEQTAQNHIDSEMHRLRMEMERLKAAKISQTAQSFAETTPTVGPGKPVRGTRSPMPANPTTPQNVQCSTPIFARGWGANPTEGIPTPASGRHPDSCAVRKNKGYTPAGYDGGNVPTGKHGVLHPDGIVDALPASTPAT